MHSRHKCILVNLEVEEDQTTKEEEEAHIEVEEATPLAQVEGAAIRIQAKAQARIKHKDRGMINLMSNDIIVTSMFIMKINVEIRKMTWVVNLVKISQNKIRTMIMCF